MKFKKFMALVLAAVCLMTMLVGCNKGNEEETGTEVAPSTTQKRFKATAHLKVVDYTGKEVYSTDEDEPFEYDSGYYAPTVIKFVEDYAFMNDKEFAVKFSSRSGSKDADSIDVISITKRKKTKDYKAGTEITSEFDGSKQKTFWVCLINGKEVDSMKETVVKDGDVVVLRLAYIGSDKVTTSKPTMPIVPDDTETK